VKSWVGGNYFEGGGVGGGFPCLGAVERASPKKVQLIVHEGGGESEERPKSIRQQRKEICKKKGDDGKIGENGTV